MFTRGYPIYFPKPGILLNGSKVDLARPTASEFKPLKPSKLGVSKTNYAHVSGEDDIESLGSLECSGNLFFNKAIESDLFFVFPLSRKMRPFT